MAQIQGALNRVKMLEHHIQHHKIIFVLAIMKSIHKYPTLFFFFRENIQHYYK